MKTQILLGALLCAIACPLAQAEEVLTLDLSQVDTTYFTAEGNGQTLRLLDGTEVPGVTYEYSNYALGSRNTPVDVCHLVFSTDLTLTGETTAFGLKAGADITLTLDGVKVTPAGHYTAGVSGLNVHTFYTGAHAVTLTLKDDTTNTFTGSYSITSGGNHSAHPGVSVASGGALIVNGSTGKLIATGFLDENGESWSASGIGSAYGMGGLGNITINGGIIEATGGWFSTGIGMGLYDIGKASNVGVITINGGTITARTTPLASADVGEGAAGIGGAYNTVGPKIVITGGTIEATGSDYAPGIGVATPSSSVPDITISGGTVSAYGGKQAAAIGGAYGIAGGTISISGDAVVTAYGGTSAPYAIGAGYNPKETELDAGALTVSGAAKVDTRGGETPIGILGACIIDLADTSSLPEGVTLEGTTLTVADVGKAIILKGSNAELTVALTGTAPELVAPAGEAYAVTLGTLSCNGAYRVEGNNSLTVKAFTGAMTLAQRSGTTGMTLTVVEQEAEADYSACTGTLSLEGRNSVAVPAAGQIQSFTPMASLTTYDGAYPKDYTTGGVDLSTLTANATLPAGWSVSTSTLLTTLSVPTETTLTQSGTGEVRNLSVVATGNLTLSGAKIHSGGMASPLTLTEGGTLTLAENTTSTLTSGSGYAAIRVPTGKALIISGTGTVEATASSGAAIGGDDGEVGGAITIQAGTVVATAFSGAAIGGGYAAGSGTIQVTGGTVVAIGQNGAGIGTGSHSKGTGADIQISGTAKILAYSSAGAAIGTGSQGQVVPTIAISGTPTIVATANRKPAASTVQTKLGVDEETATGWLALMTLTSDTSGAAIGGGQNACFGTITISGGDLTVAALEGSAIGGGGNYANISNPATAAADSITISGAGTTISATSEAAAAIGAGAAVHKEVIAVGSISIDAEATVSATTNGVSAAAIGGTGKTGVKTISIGNKSNVTADSFGSGSGASVIADVSISDPSAVNQNPISTADGISTVNLNLAKAVMEPVANGATTLKTDGGTVVARVEQTPAAEGSGQTTALVVLDPTLKLESGKMAVLLTKQKTEADDEAVMEKAWLLNAGLVFAESSESETPAYDLTYTYEFGIQDFTIGAVTAEGIELTRVVVGLTEGETPRSATLNGYLRVKSGSTVLFEVENPTFTAGAYLFEGGETPPKVTLAEGKSTIVLTVHLAKE